MHKSSLWIVLLVCAALFSCTRQAPSLYDVIPVETVLFLETDDPQAFLDDLKGKAYMEPFLRADVNGSWIESMTARADSLLQLDPALRTRIMESSMALAFVPVEGRSRGLLMAKLSDQLSDAELKRFFKSHGIDCDFRKNGKSEYYHLRDLDSLFVFVDGPFLGLSKDVQLVERCFEQLEAPLKINSSGDFQRLQKTLGQHVKAHLYYQDTHAWMAMDVLPGESELVMNGYTLPTDSLSALKPLKYQLPVKNSIVNLLPFDTRFMLHYGMSDYASYWQSYRDEEEVKAQNKRYGIDVEKQLLEHLSEVSLDVVGQGGRELFVARMSDPSSVIKFMEKMSSKTGVRESLSCQGYVLYDLGERDFVPAVFGSSFQNIQRMCYAIVDQYLVIASDFSTLQGVIACYRSGRTLDMNENYRTFQQRMLESCNVTLFSTGQGNQQRFASLIGGILERYLSSHRGLLDEFQAVSFQLASSKDLVYTNVCMTQMGTSRDESNVRWKVNLDAPLKGRPYMVPGNASDCSNVVVFDCYNKMYLINSEGRVLWTKELEEPPLGEVFSVEEGNNSSLLLFNTAHTLQLINGEGADHPGFPVRLPFEASNGLTVLDYNHNKDYRILLCGKDKLVYNYDIQGKEVEGWNRHRSEELVNKPIQHIVADDKDYLVVSDVSGGVRILDRQGRIRIPLPSDMQKSPTADIYANATNRKKGLFLTSDKEGQLLYVTADGTMNKTDFGTYSPNHFFLYEDFNGDQDPDFIYLDGKDLLVFDKFKKELFSYHFDVDITTKPVFFNITRTKRLLGVVSEKAREIYLIDRKGKMIVNSGLVGETPFAVGSLHNDQEINLVTGVGNALFNYAIYR